MVSSGSRRKRAWPGATSVTSPNADLVAGGKKRPVVAGLVVIIIGAFVSTAGNLPVVIVGLGLINIGFFTSHAVATGWVGSLADHQKGHAASLYVR